MSVLVAEVYEALIEAGASEPKARAAAAAVPAGAHLATQQDVAAVKQELKQDIAAVKQDIAAVKQELKQDIAKLQTETAIVKFAAVFTFSPIIMTLLVKLVFFP